MQERQRLHEDLLQDFGGADSSEIARTKSSLDFNSLSDEEKAALTSISDEKQFPASVVPAGATLYGKDSSQASKVDNKAILAGGCLDVSQAVL